ncbi:MAG: cyanophycin synthetase, partial [Rhodothermales bacterium]|nr:cyanophycin synthetase [Rhodothermales bacterium]
LQPDVSVVTEISLEHTDILGKTIGQIAGEKAGIIKPGVPALTIAGGEALDVLRSRASALRAPFEDVRSTCSVSSARFRLSGTTLDITTPNKVYDDLELSLAGRHQVWNAALALRAADTFARRTESGLPMAAMRKGLSNVRRYTGLAGRLQLVSKRPDIITDNAHNLQGLEAVVQHVREFSTGRLYIALGLMKDKDAEGVADLLARISAPVTVIELFGDRALDARTLISLLKQRGVRVDSYGSVADVVERFRGHADADDVLLLTGSHLVVGEVIGAV